MGCIDFKPTVSNKPPSNKRNRAGLIVGIVVGVGAVSFLVVLAFFYVIRKRKRHDDDEGKYSIIWKSHHLKCFLAYS